METSKSAEPVTPERRGPVVKIGPLTLKGAWAIVALLVIFSLLAAAVIDLQPRPTMLASFTLWLIMDVYWSIALQKRPPAKTAESPESRRVHVTLNTLALVLLFVPIPGLNGHFVPDTLTTAAVGLGIQVGFTLFYFWARVHLGRVWSGAITIMDDHQLINSGPYRVLRHPMYTGMLGMAAGTAIVSGTYHALAGVALVTIAYARKIRIEERVLRNEFGESYETYRRKTSALIPWLL